MATPPSKYNPVTYFRNIFQDIKKRSEEDHPLSFDERQECEKAYESIDRGTSMVPLDKIVGSVGRYLDFDSQFKPKNTAVDERLQAILQRMKEGRSLPPIALYQIKDDYFILDGHHRFTAARELGHSHINACILELLPSEDTLENRLYIEKTEFRDKAGLPRAIDLTELGQFSQLDWQIKEHQRFLANQSGQKINYQQAAMDWYHSIYQPLHTLIKNSGLAASFANRTVDDLYLYISDHQWRRGKERKYGIGVDKLIPKDMQAFRQKMAEHSKQDYPEMRREITAFIMLNVEGKHEQRIFDRLVDLAEIKEVHSVHGSIDIIAKVVLMRDLLSSDAELISHFISATIRQWRGVKSTQTLLPGMTVIKDTNKNGLK